MDKFSAWINSVISHEMHKRADAPGKGVNSNLYQGAGIDPAVLGKAEADAKFKEAYGNWASPEEAMGTPFYRTYKVIPQFGKDYVENLKYQLDNAEKKLLRAKAESNVPSALPGTGGMPIPISLDALPDTAFPEEKKERDMWAARYRDRLRYEQDMHATDAQLYQDIFGRRIDTEDAGVLDLRPQIQQGRKLFHDNLEAMNTLRRIPIDMWGRSGDFDTSAMQVNKNWFKWAEKRFKELASKANYPSLASPWLNDYQDVDFSRLTDDELREFVTLYAAVAEARQHNDYVNHVSDVVGSKAKSVASGITGIGFGQREQQLRAEDYTSDMAARGLATQKEVDNANRFNMALNYVGTAGGAGLTAAIAPKVLPAGIGSQVHNTFLTHAGNQAFGVTDAFLNPNDGGTADTAMGFVRDYTADFTPMEQAVTGFVFRPVSKAVGKGLQKAIASVIKRIGTETAQKTIENAVQAVGVPAVMAGAPIVEAAVDGYVDKTKSGQTWWSWFIPEDEQRVYYMIRSGRRSQAYEDRYVSDAAEKKLTRAGITNPTTEQRETAYALATNDYADMLYNEHVTKVVDSKQCTTAEQLCAAKIAAIDELVKIKSKACSLPVGIWSDRDIPIATRLNWASIAIQNQALVGMSGMQEVADFVSGTDDVKVQIKERALGRLERNSRAHRVFGAAMTGLIQEARLPGNNVADAIKAASDAAPRIKGLPTFMEIANRMPQHTVTKAMQNGLAGVTPEEAATVISTFSGMQNGEDKTGLNVFDQWPALKNATATVVRTTVSQGKFTAGMARMAEEANGAGVFDNAPEFLKEAVAQGLQDMDAAEFSEHYMKGKSAEQVISMLGTKKGSAMLNQLPEEKRKAIVDSCTTRGKEIVLDWWKHNLDKTHIVASLWLGMNGHDELAEYAKDPVMFYGTLFGVLGIGALAIGAIASDDDDEDDEDEDEDEEAPKFNERKIRAALRARADA